MEKKVRIFKSFAAADEANAREEAAMTPEQRLNILIELRNQRHPDAAEQRLERVYRITKLPQK